MRVVDIKALAKDIMTFAGRDVEKYSTAARDIINKNSHAGLLINSEELTDALDTIKSLRKSERFLALAHSSLISELEFNDLDSRLIGSFWSLHGLLALNLNLADAALASSLRATDYLKDDRSALLVTTYSQIATAARNLRDYATAIKYYGMAKKVAEELSFKELSTWQVFRLGKMYVNYLEQPSRALKYLADAHLIFESINTLTAKKGAAACLDEIGDIYRQTTTNLDRAEQLYKESLRINTEIEYLGGVARNLAHLGLCAERRGLLERAKSMLEESVGITRKEIGQERGVAIRLGQLARVCIEAGEIEYAEKCLQEASQLTQDYRDYRSMASHLIKWGSLYRKIKKYNKAKESFYKAMGLAKKHRMFDIESDSYYKLSELCLVDLQDYAQAKEMALQGVRVRQTSWNYITESNPKLEEVEDKVEIANMYKSLFEKLFEDYKNDLASIENTTKKAYDIALDEAQRRHSNLSQLFKFGAVMSGTKHEILNLLNGVASELRNILGNQSVAGTVRDSLDKSRNRLLRGAELLSGSFFESLIASEAGHAQNISFSTLTVLPPIYEWVRQEAIQQNCNIHIDEEIPDVFIAVEPSLIRVIVMNLIQNAIDSFAEKNARYIRLRTREDAADKFLVIEIADNGSGMTDHKLTQIVQFGWSTKPGHVGLGLPTVRFLLDSVDSDVKVKSKFGEGTTFLICFPSFK